MSKTTKLGKKIGAGRTAEIYELSTDTVIKLFYKQFSAQMAQTEYTCHKAIQDCNLPIPKIYDFINVSGRSGIVYEKVIGDSLLSKLKQQPFMMKKYAFDMADLHFDIGSTKAPEELPTLKKMIVSPIKRQTLLNDTEKEAVLEKLKTAPNGDNLCHTDFHPDNIIVNGDKYWVIDWMTACRDCFEADFTRTSMILNYSASPNAKLYEKLLSKTFGSLFSKMYTDRLVTLGLNLKEANKWQVPIMAGRLAENVSHKENNTLVKIIRSQLN